VRRERWILQKRIEPRALKRRGIESGERTGQEKRVGQRAGGHRALHADGAHPERFAQAPAMRGEGRAEHRRHAAPEQHRAFVVSPRAGDLVEKWFVRVRIVGDDREREVGAHERRDHQREGAQDAERGDLRARRARRAQPKIAAMAADKPRQHLEERRDQAEARQEQAEFGRHRPPPGRHSPRFFSASTTSFGT
jgi:hypothetical protein